MRDDIIYNAARAIAQREGYLRVTRPALAEESGLNFYAIKNHCRISELHKALKEDGFPPGEPHRNDPQQGEDTKRRILQAAVKLAELDGYQWLTRKAVADQAGLAQSASLVSHYFGSMVGLKRAVLRHAVEHRLLPIVAQGLADQHPIVTSASADLRAATAAYLAGA